MIKSFKHSGLAITLAAATLFGAQTAAAGTIAITYAGAANFGNGSLASVDGWGYKNGQVAPNPNSSSSLVAVGIGGDSDTSSNLTYNFSATGQFNTWCVDIYHWLSGGTVTYTVATGADLAANLSALRPGTPTGTTRVTELIQLANDNGGRDNVSVVMATVLDAFPAKTRIFDKILGWFG